MTVVLLLSGCFPFHRSHPEASSEPSLHQKSVALEEAPASLIASDGSRCSALHAPIAAVRAPRTAVAPSQR